jgi:hypothetical protein
MGFSTLPGSWMRQDLQNYDIFLTCQKSDPAKIALSTEQALQNKSGIFSLCEVGFLNSTLKIHAFYAPLKGN